MPHIANAEGTKTIAVLALGNLMHGDDGVGIHLLRALESQNPKLTAECEARGIELRWIEGGTQGLELTHSLDGVNYLLVLDAVAMQQTPGTVARYAGDSLYQLPVGRSVHLMGLSDLLVAIQLLGNPPREVILLGVEPESTAWSLEMSAQVTAALPLLLGVAKKQIVAWMESSEHGRCSGSCGCVSAGQCHSGKELHASLR
ncbi:MAG TPA: hydrogenase maturation protease [Acidobacteriaceae bacterium]|nr:hydrogenase maturation protease [Acidobacteriaceae bacterium]